MRIGWWDSRGISTLRRRLSSSDRMTYCAINVMQESPALNPIACIVVEATPVVRPPSLPPPLRGVIFASSPLDVHFSLLARSLLRLIEGRKDIESPHMGHFCLAPSGSLLLVTPSHQTRLRSFVHRIPPSDKFRARRPPITAVCTRNSEETQSFRPPQEPMEEGRETQYSKGAPIQPLRPLLFVPFPIFLLPFPAPRRHHIINTLAAPWSFHFALSTESDRLRVTLAYLQGTRWPDCRPIPPRDGTP